MNAAKLSALLRKPQPSASGTLPELVAARDPVATTVFSFLLWESTTPAAIDAYERLQQTMVDFNDLRVSLPAEVIAVIGARHPRAEERCSRLRATLNDIFRREHAVRFPQLAGGKRDIKAYVESLEGMVGPYVASRVLLLCFGVHGIPVDEQTRAVLADAGVCEPDVDLAELGASLARHVKAEHAEAAHQTLQSLVDAAGSRSGRKSAAKPRKGRAGRT